MKKVSPLRKASDLLTEQSLEKFQMHESPWLKFGLKKLHLQFVAFNAFIELETRSALELSTSVARLRSSVLRT